jgi:hypothetical protein
MSTSTVNSPSAKSDTGTYRPPSGRPKSPLLSIGEGGWTIHFPPYQEGSIRYGRGSLEHYGDTWRKHLDDLTPDAVGTDTRTIPDADLVRFAVAGPMVDVTLPKGQVAHLHGDTAKWQDVPTDGRDPRFGNARPLDLVALDVYLTILLRFGGRVFDPHGEGSA